MSPQGTQPRVSDIRLERYRLGELPPDERDGLAALVASDPTLQERLAALDRSDREIAAAYPSRNMAADVRRKANAPSPTGTAATSGRPRAWLAPAVFVAASVCLVAIASSVLFRQPVVPDTTIKGGGPATLVLHRRVAHGSEELKPGAVVREGDQIRVGYRASGHRFGAILSIDGRGILTSHLPRTGEQAAPLQPTGTVFLDFAYELDDAPRRETFYFVAADAPFELENVRRAIRDAGINHAGALSLPGTFTQFTFPLTKDRP